MDTTATDSGTAGNMPYDLRTASPATNVSNKRAPGRTTNSRGTRTPILNLQGCGSLLPWLRVDEMCVWRRSRNRMGVNLADIVRRTNAMSEITFHPQDLIRQPLTVQNTLK